MTRKPTLALALAVPTVAALIAGCSSTAEPGSGSEGGGGGDGAVTLKVATSQAETAPNYYCGVELLKDRLEGGNAGFTVELFPSSQLGPDTERIAQLQAGDIDVDLQGSGNLGAIHTPMGVTEAAYAWDGTEDLFEFLDGADGDALKQDWSDASQTTAVDAWVYGMRTLSTIGEEIRSPDDMSKVPIRFPDSPQYLANANSMGANVVSVAYEEVYTALQQGIAKGQENPIPGTRSQSYDEILDTFMLNNHQISLHWVVVSNATMDKLNDEQKELLISTIKDIRGENLDCVNKETNEILDEYRADADKTVVEAEDIDLPAFRAKAEAFFMDYYKDGDLELYKKIREYSGD
ncbi:MAG: TRAP transporter substrate-binding protein DctP [Propioniciclava sp.]